MIKSMREKWEFGGKERNRARCKKEEKHMRGNRWVARKKIGKWMWNQKNSSIINTEKDKGAPNEKWKRQVKKWYRRDVTEFCFVFF